MNKVRVFDHERVTATQPFRLAIAAEVMNGAHAAAFIATSGNWGLVGESMPADQDPCASDNPRSCITAAALRALWYALKRAPEEGPVHIEIASSEVAEWLTAWQQGIGDMPEWYRTERTDDKTPTLKRLQSNITGLGERLVVTCYVGVDAGPLWNAALTMASVSLQHLQGLTPEDQARKDAGAIVQEAIHTL